jgi:ribose transport system permease protein
MTDVQFATANPATRLLRIFANSREMTLLVLIVVLSVSMSIIYPNNFPTASNMAAVLLNAAQNGILVTGMMLLMIAGAFDLSIGSTLALAGVWSGLVVARHGYPPVAGILVGLGIGAVAGAINGFIVTRIKINPLIATLATMSIFRGVTYVTGGTGINPITDDFKVYGQTVIFGLQTPFWVMLIVVAIAAFLVSKTRFFRQYYFIGGNPKAAKLSGIQVDKLVMIAFIIMGTLAGLTGVLQAARLNSAMVTIGVNVELAVITATVLGGASLKGGEGSILGAVLGVLFIALVNNAMIINSVGVFWQGIVIGSVLLLAVSLDSYKGAAR